MPKDTAGSTIWTIGKLVQAVKDKSGTGTTRIEIPRFQRHLVWNERQRVDLIDSIHKGYPIGSIMLFKRFNPGSSHEVYQVVDGLQRTSTLVHYAERPLTYVPSTSSRRPRWQQLLQHLKWRKNTCNARSPTGCGIPSN